MLGNLPAARAASEKAVRGSSQGVARCSRARGLYQVALTIFWYFQRTLSRCWNFALYPFCVVLSFGSSAWLMSSSGIRDGVCKVCSFGMKGAIEMEVFWCPTWRTAGGMSASGVTYWAWRGMKVKAWPNCVVANKDQLGHRKGGGEGNMVKISLASPGRCMEGWEHWAGTYRSLGLESVMGKVRGALQVVNLGRRGAFWVFWWWVFFFLLPSSCCGFECYKSPRKSCRLLWLYWDI